MWLDRESASQFERRFRDVVSGTGSFGKPCPVSSRNSGSQFPSEVSWGKSDPEFAWIVGRTFRRAVPPQLRRVATRCITTCKSATLVQHASVAQGIEHRSPKAGVDGSNPPGGTRDLSSPVHRHGTGLFWFMSCQKRSARLLGEQAGACERICLRREP